MLDNDLAEAQAEEYLTQQDIQSEETFKIENEFF